MLLIELCYHDLLHPVGIYFPNVTLVKHNISLPNLRIQTLNLKYVNKSNINTNTIILI